MFERLRKKPEPTTFQQVGDHFIIVPHNNMYVVVNLDMVLSFKITDNGVILHGNGGQSYKVTDI